MDFFARQDQSRRSTRYLLLLFALAFLTVALVTTLAAAWAVNVYAGRTAVLFTSAGWPEALRAHWPLLAGVAAVTFGAMLLASLGRSASLSRGGGQVARMLGGTPIDADTTDPLHRRLVNVVEEMAIASGLPVPEIYVLEHEPGINAFAAGLTHADAAIAVTRGALDRLNRAELQGVIAHEFSHVLNGDMRLNQQLIGLSFGILVLALAGRWLLRSLRFARFTRRSRNSGGIFAIVLIGLALTVIGAIGVLLSRLIKAAVSRQREALADASAVQFTREPSGLAGALKKIGGYTADLQSVETEEVAHMLFGEVGRHWRGWLATHPPLVERIRALDPSFEPGDYPEAAPLPAGPSDESAPVSGLGGSAATAPEDLVARAGHIEAPAVGAALRGALPEELEHAVHSRDTSLLVVLALTLSDDDTIAKRQRQLIESQLGANRAELCARLNRELETLDPRLRLPLLQLTMPAIKKRPPEQLQYLLDLVERLLDVDQQKQLFDYVLLRLLGAYLTATPAASVERPTRPRLRTDTAVVDLLAVTAAFGHRDAAAARAAFDSGLELLETPRDALAAPDFTDLASLRDTSRLDAALDRLAGASATAKQRILAALLGVIRHDRKVEIAELELFRAIAAVLGCPLPPSVSIRADGRIAQIG